MVRQEGSPWYLAAQNAVSGSLRGVDLASGLEIVISLLSYILRKDYSKSYFRCQDPLRLQLPMTVTNSSGYLKFCREEVVILFQALQECKVDLYLEDTCDE